MFAFIHSGKILHNEPHYVVLIYVSLSVEKFNILLFQADPYGMQSLNPNHYRVVTKQEPDDMEHYDRGRLTCFRVNLSVYMLLFTSTL